ncbi:integral peroxisomal membrane peroxin-domain-containing protein [Lentinula raphanica]|nr:integral peroxisomal membrane peroxin-domain-containing protein [Lentinula raphanica]
MATLDYLSIPSSASRLQIQPQLSSSKSSRIQLSNENDIRSAPKLRTSLPRSSAESFDLGPTSPLKTFASGSAFNILPSLLLSSSMPSSVPASDPTSPSDSTKSNPAKKRARKLYQEPIVLLSNKDPLSIQITSVNFKRFIERVGPVFWLQDRLEEIVFWRRGWKLTGTWLALYGFLCRYPRLVFAFPHVILIAIILASVHYPVYKPPLPPVTLTDPASTATPTESPTNVKTSSTAETPLPAPVVEDSVDWQANIQAIQNLMGFYADLHVAITPYLSHLSLSPNNPQISKPKSPYTLPFLIFLTLTLLPFIFFITSPLFPVRLVCFLSGAGPVLSLNPQLRRWYSDVVHLIAYYTSQDTTYNPIVVPIPPVIRLLSSRFLKLSPPSHVIIDSFTLEIFRKRIKMRLQRFLDDNNLSDKVWNSEIREVELWENERLDPSMMPLSPSTSTISASPKQMKTPLPPPPSYSKRLSIDETGITSERKVYHAQGRSSTQHQHQRSRSTFFGGGPSLNKGWSKSHLKTNDRAPWTRGRDGWSGVAGSGADGDGTVSNLTFSLAPNWEFVPTEDWRADLVGEWVNEGRLLDEEDGMLGADENGWVYTNDVWLVPANHAYSGAVTRRRRWVRRIWYNSQQQESDKED